MMALQRALQLAGARSVVASLWKVPDNATRHLMREFYGGVWATDPVGKAQALQQAQLWLLREAPRHPDILRDLLVPGVDAPPKDAPLPPFYWAAFVLSGDWH